MASDEHGGAQPPDNHADDPGRLFGVTGPDGWESELRRTLAGVAGRAAATPAATSDLAGTVLARARRARRRRRAGALAGIVAVTMLAAGTAIQAMPVAGPGDEATFTGLFGDGPEPDQSQPAPTDIRLATDDAVVAQMPTGVVGTGGAGGLVLATVDGARTELGSISDVTAAYRVGDGVALIGGAGGAARLWWVDPDGEQQALLTGMDTIVMDHSRVAWQRGAMLSAAVVSGTGELEQRVNTRAPDGGGPVGFLGDAVLLGHASGNSGSSWDLWVPARGEYRPAWTEDAELAGVYGALPDQRAAVGSAPPAPGADHSCLVRLRIERPLAVTEHGACLPGSLAGTATVSPDGRWLVGATDTGAAGTGAADTGSGGAGGPVVVDLAAALTGAPGAVAVVDGAPAPAGPPVWLTADRAVFTTMDSVVELRPEHVFSGAAHPARAIPLTGEPPVLVQPGR